MAPLIRPAKHGGTPPCCQSTNCTPSPATIRRTPDGAWIDALHAALDQAVAAAYGWPEDIATDDALARLLALNHARPGR